MFGHALTVSIQEGRESVRLLLVKWWLQDFEGTISEDPKLSKEDRCLRRPERCDRTCLNVSPLSQVQQWMYTALQNHTAVPVPSSALQHVFCVIQ